jgi:hypothetical protein
MPTRLRSPTELFGRMALFILLGGVAFRVLQKSLIPMVIVVAALGTLLRFTNSLERRRERR